MTTTMIPVSSQLKSLFVSSGATTTLVPCDTYVNTWLLKRYRPLPAASSRHESTTATRCCMALLFSVAEKLQRAQNNVASHMPSSQMCQCQITTKVPSLAACPTVHPVENIAVITHKALSTSVPPYIDELLQRQVTTRSLWSTDAPRLSVPWTLTETAKWAFCMMAPNVWNLLPNDICNASSMSSFHAKLKSHFLLLRTRDDIPTATFLCWLSINIMAL